MVLIQLKPVSYTHLAIILYMNELDKSELTRDVVVGSSGEKIDYSTDEQIANSVSYTHLDVYKRQVHR